MQDLRVSIQKFNPDQEKRFWRMLEAFPFHSDRSYYEQCLQRHAEGTLIVLMACVDDEAAGYCILNWQPKYAFFKKEGIAEIQDLNVLVPYRRRGIGQRLIAHCETLVQEKGQGQSAIGIGVGLDHSFGAAQRLYVRLGYIPDGAGVCYDRKQVAAGDFWPIDENLSLMMVKTLI